MIQFFCDTNCEINYEIAKQMNMNVIRMPYTICDKEYFYDLGENYDAKWFFDLVRAKNMPITSALNAEDYKAYFEPFFAKGDEIFYVSFSAELSGTFKYMEMALKDLREKYPDLKFTRYDTRAISYAAGLAVFAAKKQLDAGKTVEEVCQFLDGFVQSVNAVILPDDLMYLKRGGRLSAASAILGGLLNIRPIIKLTKEGTLAALSKVSGKQKAFQTVSQEIIQNAKQLDEYPIVILDADAREDSDKIKERIAAGLPNAKILQYSVGPVIGTHCGPQTIGICYVGAPRPNKP